MAIAVQEGLVVLDPTARPRANPIHIAPRSGQLQGKVLGILDNSKRNAGPFLSRLGELLQAEHGIRETVAVRKRTMWLPLDPQSTEALAQRIDIAITAFGD